MTEHKTYICCGNPLDGPHKGLFGCPGTVFPGTGTKSLSKQGDCPTCGGTGLQIDEADDCGNGYRTCPECVPGSRMTLIHDGVEYGLEVQTDEEGQTRIKFTSTNPPRGLHETIYEFVGRLPA